MKTLIYIIHIIKGFLIISSNTEFFWSEVVLTDRQDEKEKLVFKKTATIEMTFEQLTHKHLRKHTTELLVHLCKHKNSLTTHIL